MRVAAIDEGAKVDAIVDVGIGFGAVKGLGTGLATGGGDGAGLLVGEDPYPGGLRQLGEVGCKHCLLLQMAPGSQQSEAELQLVP